jgi:hypothetical protein
MIGYSAVYLDAFPDVLGTDWNVRMLPTERVDEPKENL